MKEYKIKTIVPTLSSVVYLDQLKNLDILSVNKYISSNDDEGLNSYIDELLNHSKLNCSIDKLFAILNLRMTCISNDIKVRSDIKGVPTTLKIDLRKILLKLLDNTDIQLKSYKKEDLCIIFEPPKSLFHKDYVSFLSDTIKCIKINDQNIDFKNIEKKERYKIIMSLKKDILKEVKDHINAYKVKYTILNLDTEDLKLKREISIYDNTSLNFIKFIFKSSIPNIYNKMYHTCKALGIGFNDYNNLTPAETDMLVAIYKKSNSIK